ncbi:hypothetical protein B2J93_4758 [Marssonina coronariae]|uniref:Multiple myeloma tumor-associated protein 2-like N-terminal domain-containing protein n=1 Tax=Diplocarpon coronariae TaxID=2795749 RepID=A0A218Z1U1_9HELO|nr:hypothetical protein B2J93_4758 [Marssonina coronariae]
MDLLSSIRKEGSRGGVNFSWDDVQTSQHRENYLGHSLMAPVGRWQKNRDLSWYAKGDDGKGENGETAEERRARERKAEIKRIKEAEEDALARALGLPVAERGTGSNSISVGEVHRAVKEAGIGEDDGDVGFGKGKSFGGFVGSAEEGDRMEGNIRQLNEGGLEWPEATVARGHTDIDIDPGVARGIIDREAGIDTEKGDPAKSARRGGLEIEVSREKSGDIEVEAQTGQEADRTDKNAGIERSPEETGLQKELGEVGRPCLGSTEGEANNLLLCITYLGLSEGVWAGYTNVKWIPDGCGGVAQDPTSLLIMYWNQFACHNMFELRKASPDSVDNTSAV